jgi:mono/diheme cytochrome c family protein
MKRVLDNLIVDAIAAILMVAVVATGYILRFPLPPGTNKSLSLWGLTRHQWGQIHFWFSLALLVLIVVHVCLHWQWIAVSVKRRFWGTVTPPKSSLGSGRFTILLLAVALALFGWAAQSGVRPITESKAGTSPPVADGDQASSFEPAAAAPITRPNNVTFWSDVYPIFEKSCLSCHGPQKQLSGFRVDRREDYFRDTLTALVLPGNSKESPLIFILSGKRAEMARVNAHRLADNELAVVTAWIDAGAEWTDRSNQ